MIYESEEAGKIITEQRTAFLQSVALFWRFDTYLKGQYDNTAERERYRRFVSQLDTALNILIREPIAQDATLSTSDIAKLLEKLKKRHAFVNTGSTAYPIQTRDTEELQTPVTANGAAQRLLQVREQTRARYCVKRSELDERETEEETEIPPEEPQPEPVHMEMQEEEPIEEVPEPEIPTQRKPEKQPPAPLPVSMDTLNVLSVQLKAKEIDPDTTILAALGEHYVLTIKQWMRLFAWGSYPRATRYFKELKDNDMIYRKDREGRGGTLVEGDWFFLLTKGANELVRRRQDSPLFRLEPNEAERASGDTLFHTSLVNEILIHLRLLERQRPDIVTIEQIDHERSMRRYYLAALAESKLYPDGFLRLLVPTTNGLKRRYTFLELQHTTQKDEANWKTKCRKYLALFDQAATLEQFFSTRTPQVLVITMEKAYIASHKQWTEEVLAEREARGRDYSNRFLFGAYDPGISDMSMSPEQFFCMPRFYMPLQAAPHAVFGT